MHQPNALTRLVRFPAPAVALKERSRELDFSLPLLGHSNAAIIPQRVGDWWMTPLRSPDELPVRARQRLISLLEAGVTPKHLVVFHELSITPRRTSDWNRRGAQVILWAQQDLPAALERASSAVKVYAPPIGKFLFKTSTLLTGVVAFFIWKVLTVAAAVAVADPCLVLVTEDGYWLEVDRWDE